MRRFQRSRGARRRRSRPHRGESDHGNRGVAARDGGEAALTGANPTMEIAFGPEEPSERPRTSPNGAAPPAPRARQLRRLATAGATVALSLRAVQDFLRHLY